jgi:hypothetical protein
VTSAISICGLATGISQELIAKLVKTGYLQLGLCNDAVAVANAIGRLKQDLRGGGDGGKPTAA